MAADEQPQKVAVLGGGPAAMAAAFELSAKELDGRFEVTVYQPGWRLGGKCASGRNRAPSKGSRIEEHGLHVWFGFYENAFKLMRAAYDELARPPGSPLATLDEAFVGCNQLALYDRQGAGWHKFVFNCPANELEPGTDEPLPGFWAIADTVCDWVLERWGALKQRPGAAIPTAEPPRSPVERLLELGRRVIDDLDAAAADGGEELLHLAKTLTSAPARLGEPLAASPDASPPVATLVLALLLTGFRDWVWDAVVEERYEQDPDLRLFFTVFDTFASTVAGVVKDGVLSDGWPAVNDRELCRWLECHGAKEVTVGATPAQRSPLLRAIYDVAFGYPGGVIADANVAAGTAVNDLLRLVFTYRGSVMYKMQAGMGDTVLTPFYEVLRRRGVKFEFFHAVTQLSLSPAGDSVETIEVVPQATPLDPPYCPLFDVDGLPCWPSTPDWGQLQDGARLQAAGFDFELEVNPDGRQPAELVRGEDFHQVVLAIPVGALEPICTQIAERHEPFRRMLASSSTVATQAFQLWLAKEPTQIGWSEEDSVCGCFVEPLDTWSDMSHLLKRETWLPEEGVNGVAYFCGVLEDRPGETTEQAQQRVTAAARAFLEEDAATLWSGSRGFAPGEPFDWSLLCDSSRAPGPARLGAQYLRANVTPSERYALTLAGTVADRLPAEGSGVENLALAGDWTSNGIDGGCVEAAMTSGMQAARALIGHERTFTGESPTWLTDPPARKGDARP